MHTLENDNDRAKDFKSAVYAGDLEKVRAYIESGIDVNRRYHYSHDNYGNHPLFSAIYSDEKAAEENRGAMLKLLLDAGARTDVTYDEGETPLIALIIESYEKDKELYGQYISLMLEYKPDLEKGDIEGATALMWTAFYDLPGITEKLLKAGAKLETTDHSGRTALICAAEFSHPEVLRLLLEAGANPFAFNKQGKKAFDLVNKGDVFKNESTAECKRLLMEAVPPNEETR